MFARSDDDKKPAPAAHPAPMPSPIATAAATASPAQKFAPSIISADLTIKGTLTSERDVQLSGRVEGDIKVANLVLTEQALVKGNVFSDEAIIRGRVEGNIKARKVQLAATAQVTGDITHGGQLSIESGASFEGNCRAEHSHLKVAAE
jgi:cytoskeletal protein CcmA (bactofilin family)